MFSKYYLLTVFIHECTDCHAFAFAFALSLSDG